MAHLLFAALYPGGANMLAPVMPLARDNGHRVTAVAAGAATARWWSAGEAVRKVNTEVGLDTAAFVALEPDLLVTGTGYEDFERNLWRMAAEHNVPSIAVVDAWTHLHRRFVFTDGGEIQPGSICVVDDRMRDEIVEGGWCRVPLHVTGHPHLQSMAQRLGRERAEKPPPTVPSLVFFSETLGEDHAPEASPGYDQFTVADQLFPALTSLAPLSLAIQPHPREDRGKWEQWIAAQSIPQGFTVLLSANGTEDLLAACDGAIGVTTMVLLEAALAGIPALSLQPDRIRALNPRLDTTVGIRLVTDSTDLPREVAAFVGSLGTPQEADPGLLNIIDNADRRLLDAIEAAL